MSNEIIKAKTFKEKWEIYTNLFWSPIFNCIDEDKILFSEKSIILWGWIPYKEYIKSKFYTLGTLKVNNHELNVYFYCRMSNKEFNHFFFVNTVDSKNNILNSHDFKLDIDRLFLKKLHLKNLSIYKIFNHPYSINCWEAMLEEFGK
jgi:hypothetical protein